MHLSVTYFPLYFTFFFFNDTATTEIYTLSLHDALPISRPTGNAGAESHLRRLRQGHGLLAARLRCRPPRARGGVQRRSEEHTSELQSRSDLVCRLLLEKKKQIEFKFPCVRSHIQHHPWN